MPIPPKKAITAGCFCFASSLPSFSPAASVSAAERVINSFFTKISLNHSERKAHGSAAAEKRIFFIVSHFIFKVKYFYLNILRKSTIMKKNTFEVLT